MGAFRKPEQLFELQYRAGSISYNVITKSRFHSIVDKLTKEKALELSIAKWRFIVFHLESGKITDEHIFNDGGTSTCGLCWRYHENSCQSCPILKSTGWESCEGTPYRKFVDQELSMSEKLFYAKAELEFLISLRKSIKK